MKITISGMPGAGKNTVAEFLAKKLGLKHYSVGNFRREMARKRGLTIQELNKLGEKERFTDKEADDWQKSLSKKDNFVIDGRLSWYFIPNSIKIFLKASPEQGAKRIFLQKRASERKYKSVKEVIRANKERIKSDIKRYKKYYGINPYNLENYDIIIDTSSSNIRQMDSVILNAVRRYIKQK